MNSEANKNRRRGRIKGLLTVGAACLGMTAAALGASSSSAPELAPDLVQGLVVQAIDPGPAFWKATKGDSTLWLLGLPPYVPSGFDWDQHGFERRLTGARELITLPPLRMEPVPIDKVGSSDLFVCLMGCKKPPSAPEFPFSSLPAQLRARYYQALTHQSRTPIGSNKADVSLTSANQRLTNLMFSEAKFSYFALGQELSAKAKTLGTPIRTVTLDSDIADISPTAYYADAEAQAACLQLDIAVAEQSVDPYRTSVDAWARGDLTGALANVGCIAAKAPVYHLEVDTVMPELEKELAQPGKAMAAIELLPLLMRDGVIERLKAEGYQVTGPDVASN